MNTIRGEDMNKNEMVITERDWGEIPFRVGDPPNGSSICFHPMLKRFQLWVWNGLSMNRGVARWVEVHEFMYDDDGDVGVVKVLYEGGMSGTWDGAVGFDLKYSSRLPSEHMRRRLRDHLVRYWGPKRSVVIGWRG